MHTPGVEGPLTVRVENNSYMDFLQVQTSCIFHSVAFGHVELHNVTAEAFGSGETDVIAAGSAKVMSCSIFQQSVDPITRADLHVEMHFNFRCVPFWAACRRSFSYHFQCVPLLSGISCLEGESFAP